MQDSRGIVAPRLGDAAKSWAADPSDDLRQEVRLAWLAERRGLFSAFL
ncbi:MAG: hypothetical protein HC910_05645 [Spirulinaceae cyanobacterium SM2_1_0]|nr:hypothetical protein [Spirulinaceae cyanobacterium SM2_1_0]